MDDRLKNLNEKTRDGFNSLSHLEGNIDDFINQMNSDFKEINDLLGAGDSFTPYKSNSTRLPSQNFDSLSNLQIIELLNLPYDDDSFSKDDKKWLWLAIVCGSITDVLITQLDILKPVDKQVKSFLGNKGTGNIRGSLDNWANGFRNGSSSPIDFQNFEMAGMKSIHQQYSFGHDPIRFLTGVYQTMTGNYQGVNRWGSIVNANFGEPIPNLIHATLAHTAHLMSDFLNPQGVGYPGTTYLMEFGSQEVRDQIAAAYRGGLFNSRTFVYQGLPILISTLMIHAYAIFKEWEKSKKINLLAGLSDKYQKMQFLTSTGIMVQNLTIASVRGLFGDPHALFRVNYPVILNTLRHFLKDLYREHRKVTNLSKKIDDLYAEAFRDTQNDLIFDNNYIMKEIGGAHA